MPKSRPPGPGFRVNRILKPARAVLFLGGLILTVPGRFLFSEPVPGEKTVLLNAGTGPQENSPALGEGPAAPNRPLRLTPYVREDFNGSPARSSSLPEWEKGLIPGLDKDLTRRYIAQYSTPPGIAWLKAVMSRGAPYLAFIRREIEKRDLPPELVYLPVIESAFLPTALSRSGAAGLWQFMKNSIAPFDMKVTDWVDERMDFWKSTQAALRKLEENYRNLGDWALALAAYNTGLGAVNRLLQRTEIRDYWVLGEKKLLKSETAHYVPKLLAVSHILSNPRRFGIEPFWPEDPEWTRISVGRAVDLELLAAEAGVDREELKKANQELRFSVTPLDPLYQLKVRGGDAGAVAAVLARKDLTLIKYYFHTVKSGDTLSALALHYGISVAQILGSNPGVQARYLKLGARLLIPALKEAGPYVRRNTQEIPAFEGVHLVKRGETFWSIALAYDVDPEVLAEANGMGLNDILREGKSLKTPIK